MEVFALVGASGTGKSHRASLVSHDLAIDAVVDDGLLVVDGRIVAGRSSKREETRIGAIKRALFHDPDHAAEVAAALAQLGPRRVLLLGTSPRMAERVAERLRLPAPSRYVSIGDVASPADIRKARRIRREHGKHVIPAPTLEVKRSFSGYLVDPLRFLLRPRRGGGDDRFVEKSVVRPTFSSLGRFIIRDTVVAAIAARAARSGEGLPRVSRVWVDPRPEGVAITLEVAVNYGFDLEAVLAAAQRRVKGVVEHMTALNVLAVDLTARSVHVEPPPEA
ncbi:MAG: Asp23/Gls24 family envelope stress response protein [bacterium]|nr:Asp23/Gls24 family envelope stress response protein [bacterium]